jgi:antitoxin (DNA-binding transcriptional repressor) of toxin-antitoxin stability system
MKTIGAKELRLHLDQVLDRVLNGEDIVVHHRLKNPVRISALYPENGVKHNLSGLLSFDAAPKKASPFDPKKSIKELYDASLNHKYSD